MARAAAIHRPAGAETPAARDSTREAMPVPPIPIDLYSDTLTKPSRGMRRAMAEAEVGDEQKFEDPTTNLLQERVAALLGKEAALFLPSGTMCNQIAFRVHCRPGDEIILDRLAHPVLSEVGGAAAIAGAQLCPLAGDRGRFTPEQVRAAIHPRSNRHNPWSRLVSVEQTTNMGGGAIWPLGQIEAVCRVAHEHGLATHMDGARLMNAVVASGVAAGAYAAPFDSAWIDFSKGLGAPVGGVLAGTRAFVAEAWRIKQMLGGAMRQSGVLAAACLYALDHNVERLAEDHAHARLLGDALAEIPGVAVEPVETNIVVFDIAGTGLSREDALGRLLGRGVRLSAACGGPTRLRAVTHLDISRSQVEEAIHCLRAVLTGR